MGLGVTRSYYEWGRHEGEAQDAKMWEGAEAPRWMRARADETLHEDVFLGGGRIVLPDDHCRDWQDRGLLPWASNKELSARLVLRPSPAR